MLFHQAATKGKFRFMQFFTKLAITVGLVICTVSSSFAAKNNLPHDLEIFPTIFKSKSACVKGVSLLSKHHRTISALGPVGWRNLVVEATVSDSWELVASHTWEVITDKATFAKIGVMPSTMQNTARILWKASRNNQAQAKDILAAMDKKCYAIKYNDFGFGFDDDDLDFEFEIPEELLQDLSDQRIGWDAYKSLHKAIGFKMDYAGHKR